MRAISQFAVWVKEPLANVGVVIVTSATLPKYIIDKLHVAIDDWDEVAYLVVKQPRELMLDWLEVGSSSMPVSSCHASELLRSVSKSCFLLNVEVSPILDLTWLGSVRGHPLRIVNPGNTGLSNAAMDKQVEEILSVTRTLAKGVLQERCVI